ncbi:MAG: GNAT family N-acetyltransferase [Clostridia bacterium]
MEERRTEEYQGILALYKHWKGHMALKALEEGKAEARVFGADRAAIICFGSRLLVEGNPGDSRDASFLTEFFKQVVFRDRWEGMTHFFMAFWHRPEWQEVLGNMLRTYRPVVVDREYYVMDLSKAPTPGKLPRGYVLRDLDAAFLREKPWENKDALLEEMGSERRDPGDFLNRSFGVCALSGDTLAGWCLSEYNHSKGCEVGIEVMEGHQRKGLGTLLTLALAEKAWTAGMREMGWSCFKDNTPSSGTARKAGFVKSHDSRAMMVSRHGKGT